jgi:hypothetical protein
MLLDTKTTSLGQALVSIAAAFTSTVLALAALNFRFPRSVNSINTSNIWAKTGYKIVSGFILLSLTLGSVHSNQCLQQHYAERTFYASLHSNFLFQYQMWQLLKCPLKSNYL